MRRLVLALALAAAGCNAPRSAPTRIAPPAPANLPAPVMAGTFSDGTPLTLDALRGRPWVVNLWLPG